MLYFNFNDVLSYLLVMMCGTVVNNCHVAKSVLKN